MNAIMRWIWSIFFVLSALVNLLARAAARRTASRRTCTRMHLAKTFYAYLLQNIGTSQQVTRVREVARVVVLPI